MSTAEPTTPPATQIEPQWLPVRLTSGDPILDTAHAIVSAPSVAPTRNGMWDADDPGTLPVYLGRESLPEKPQATQ